MMDTIQAPSLAALPSVRHAFFTRNGGVSTGIYTSLNAGLASADEQEAVRENRRRIADHMGVDASCLLTCYQVHSADVAVVTEPWLPEDRPRVDALVTRVKGLALGILTADCCPVLFADAEAGVIGAAHAGWRGAVAGVLDNTVAEMEKLGADRRRIKAALGPCIWQESYEVGPEFPVPFIEQDVQADRFFKASKRPGHFLFDLPGYVAGRLQALGLAAIAPSLADTYADETRFFSYRRNTEQGIQTASRLISAILLRPS